jgi:hypothetical protein
LRADQRPAADDVVVAEQHITADENLFRHGKAGRDTFTLCPGGAGIREIMSLVREACRPASLRRDLAYGCQGLVN